MANILVIIPGVSLDNLSAMPPAELMRWHKRAVARAPKNH